MTLQNQKSKWSLFSPPHFNSHGGIYSDYTTCPNKNPTTFAHKCRFMNKSFEQIWTALFNKGLEICLLFGSLIIQQKLHMIKDEITWATSLESAKICFSWSIILTKG